MAKEFFKDLPNTTTPLTASRLNGLLDGDEAMGQLVVDSIKSKNILNNVEFVKGRLNQNTGQIEKESGTTALNITNNMISFTTNTAWNNGATSGFIPVSQGDYTYSGTSDKNISFFIDTYDSSKNWVARLFNDMQNGAKTKTFTIGSGVAYIRFHYETPTADTYTITNPQIEKGSSATTFQIYQDLNPRMVKQTYTSNGFTFVFMRVGDVIQVATDGSNTSQLVADTNYSFEISRAFKPAFPFRSAMLFTEQNIVGYMYISQANIPVVQYRVKSNLSANQYPRFCFSYLGEQL